MESNEQVLGSKRFGAYLRTIRESRKLSLDAVEEMTVSSPERVTKSHLSRIENGLAIPTFPRLLALGQIYGVPIGSLAERFEIELRREMAPVELGERVDSEVLDEARALIAAGRYSDALMSLLAIWDRRGHDASHGSTNGERTELRLHIINCLSHLRRFETAKQHCEEVLAGQNLGRPHRLLALHYYVDACIRLGRYAIANMAFDQVARVLADGNAQPGETDFAAYFGLLKGNVAIALADPDTAAAAYEDALQRFSAANNTYEACRARILLGAAYASLGRATDAELLLRTGLRDSEEAGYDRFSALALHHLGIVAYRSGDSRAAAAHLLRSNGLARSRDYVTLVFGNCYYLWRMARETGDESAARTHFRSLRSLIGRVEDALPEVEDFRAAIARGES